LNSRRLVIAAHDLTMTALALMVSFFLRWGSTQFWNRIDSIAIICLMTLPLALAAHLAFRLPRSPWKYVSISDLSKIVLTALVPAIFLVLLDFVSRGQLVVPRTVPVIYWLVQIFLLAAPRVAYRVYRSRRRERRAFKGVYRMPVLIAGTDDEAEQLIRRLSHDTVSSLEPVALLATRSRHVGERIQGVPILGEIGDLDALMRDLEARGVKPRRLIVTRDTLENAEGIDELLVSARRLGLSTVRPSESLRDIGSPSGPVKLAPVSIDDLLNRSAREMDMTPVHDLVAGRRVVVTGAGGSIGSELCRQIAAMEPSELMLLDQSELALWGIARELRVGHPGLATLQHLGSVTDRAGLAAAFASFRPELVFHAAALKHVDLVEAHPVAAAATNTLGTRLVAEAALEAGAICAVFISTDKAVDPVSVLGATKRAGELVWAACDRRNRNANGAEERRTRFLTVRFGNVLGSSGSVIPLFTEQLSQGGPITVTHPEVERYFMTISEAVRLVLMASALGVRTPETSPTFVLDMGKPVKIVDLARRMIRLAGLEPDVEVEIVFTGLRPGERLTEQLEFGSETLRETEIPGVSATDASAIDPDRLEAQLDRLSAAITGHDRTGVIATLEDLVPEYRRAKLEGRDRTAADAGDHSSTRAKPQLPDLSPEPRTGAAVLS
jgi:FlaA1/EpsC-like NDP-sugar epimerase